MSWSPSLRRCDGSVSDFYLISPPSAHPPARIKEADVRTKSPPVVVVEAPHAARRQSPAAAPGPALRSSRASSQPGNARAAAFVYRTNATDLTPKHGEPATTKPCSPGCPVIGGEVPVEGQRVHEMRLMAKPTTPATMTRLATAALAPHCEFGFHGTLRARRLSQRPAAATPG